MLNHLVQFYSRPHPLTPSFRFSLKAFFNRPTFLSAIVLSLLGGFSLNALAQNPTRLTRHSQENITPALSAQDLQHIQFLNRITWGVNEVELEKLQSMGRQAYLQSQLNHVQPLPSVVEQAIKNLPSSRTPFVERMMNLQEFKMQQKAMKANHASDNNSNNNSHEAKQVNDIVAMEKAYQKALSEEVKDMASRLIWRDLYSPNQLHEKMHDFWLNHFYVSAKKANLRAMLGDYSERLHPYALGKFKDLLRTSAMHPAMLRYLDNEHNKAQKINENYAREILELHTMGIGSGYTQSDIQELARVLTGYTLVFPHQVNKMRHNKRHNAPIALAQDSLAVFNPEQHDNGDKKFLGIRIKGGGMEELNQVMDLLCQQRSTAKLVSRKLAQYFVGEHFSDALVEKMADTFLQSDGDIKQVLTVLLNHPDFDASLGSKFKTPQVYLFSALRMGVSQAQLQQLQTQDLASAEMVIRWLNKLGQALFGHITPDGYAMSEKDWNSSGQMQNRFDIATQIGRGGLQWFATEEALKNAQAKQNNEINHDANNEMRARMPQSRLDFTHQKWLRMWMTAWTANTQKTLRDAEKSSSKSQWAEWMLSAPEMMYH